MRANRNPNKLANAHGESLIARVSSHAGNHPQVHRQRDGRR